MNDSLIVAIAIALSFGLSASLLIYLGWEIRRKQRIGYVAWYRTDRVQDVAGFTRWIGTGLMIEGAVTLVAGLAVIIAGHAGGVPGIGRVLYVWTGLFVIWFVGLAVGTKRYY